MSDNELFVKCTEIKLMKNGTIEIHCKLGLWSVSGADIRSVSSEARRYWAQYYADGEYDAMIEAGRKP